MKRGLRSRLAKYGDNEFSLFLRRGFLKSAGYDDTASTSRSSASFRPRLTSILATAPQLAEAVK